MTHEHENRMKARLPMPPSANRYWRSYNARRSPVRSVEAREYMRTVGHLLASWRPLSGRVAVSLVVSGLRANADLDNRIKILLDALTGHAWEDDAQVWSIRAERAEGAPGVDVEVSPWAAASHSVAIPAPTWRDLADEQEAPEPYRRGVPTPNVRGGR